LPRDVLERAVAGDRAAVRTVVEASCGYVRGLLFKVVGPSSDLDDLQQTALLHLVQALPRTTLDGNFTTFLGSIVMNVVRDHFRRKRVRAVVTLSGGSDDFVAPQSAASEDARIDAAGRLAQCRRALARLSEAQRTAFVLRTVYGHSVDEIADMTGSLRSTTRLRLYYGRKLFSRALAEEIWP
jgi:RNA polymerase sigma-70 factor (ECF subfamily)